MTPAQRLNQMRKIWLAQEPDQIASLLAENLEYHESPLEPPLTTIQDVIDAWQEINTI